MSASRTVPDRRKETARAVMLALASVSSLSAHAVGLGPVQGSPILGEPLRLEIPLIGSFDRPVDDACIVIRRSPEAIDADYFPRNLVGRLDTRSAPSRIILSGDVALRQPLVEFRITVTCGYNLARDYVLMASPRSERPQPAQPTAPSAETVAAPTMALQHEPARRVVPNVVAPAVQAAGSLPDGLPGNSVTLDQDMTLEQLARQHFPGPLRQGRFMRWVAEANPQLFAGATNLREHRLPVGTQLVVPVGTPPRRPGDYQHGVTPLGEPMPPAPASEASAPTALAAQPSARSPARGEGKPAPEGKKDRLVVGASGGSAPGMKETMVLVERLTGMMQEQISAQSADRDKIQQLESTIAELGKTIAHMEAESRRREAALQTELQALRAERLDDEARGWWQLALAVMGGGLLGVALMWIQRLYSERKHKDETSYEALLAKEIPAKGMSIQPPSPPEPTLRPEPAPVAPVASSTPPVGSKSPTTSVPPTRPVPLQPQFKPTPPTPPKPVISAPAPTLPPLTAAAAEPPLPPRLEFEPPASIPPLRPLMEPITLEPAASPGVAAIELANIMATMGLADSAATALETHIRENPRDSLPHWLKLLELHRASGNRAEFERAANEMRQHFNVQTDEWGQEPLGGRTSIEAYPHLRMQLIRQWRQPGCASYLESLLTDTREGTRAGFSVAVAEEILLLVAILNSDD